MGDLVLAGATSGTTTLTPTAVSGTTTLTLPATTGTLLQSGTAVTVAQGGTGLTAVGSSGNLLTSNGTAWTSTAPAASGGMTLLGTLTTTSGTTQTLSGLTLTNYKYLFFSYTNVGWNTAASLIKNGTTINISRDAQSGAGESVSGNLMIDLSSGVFSAMTGRHVSGTIEVQASAPVVTAGLIPSWNTSTTSLSFAGSAGSFTSGTIKVYGVS